MTRPPAVVSTVRLQAFSPRAAVATSIERNITESLIILVIVKGYNGNPFK